MKRVILFIAVLAIISCKQEPKIDTAIVSGKVLNKNVKNLFLSNEDSSIMEFIKVSEDGTFSDTINIKEGFYNLKGKTNITELYIKPNSNINVNFDANDIKNSIAISGTGSEISSYLISKRNKEIDILGTDTAVYLLEEGDYKSKMLDVKSTILEELDAVAGIPEDFKEKEKRNIHYTYLSYLNKYERYHAHYADNKEFKVSQGFLSELNDISFKNEEDFLFSKDYENLVYNHYQKAANELAKNENIKTDIATLKIASGIENEIIKNKLLFTSSIYGITYTKDLEEFYSTFSSACTNSKFKDIITKSYNTLKTVSKGQESPKFVNYENFSGGTTSLEDLKGKFVYIDVWATWCGPCKAEIPALKKIEEKYHGKNIEFVSISIDAAKDHAKWKAMVEEKELKGVQLFADKDWKSQFVTDYLIKGIPKFILIDPAGKIVDSNAPRPSSEELIELFEANNI